MKRQLNQYPGFTTAFVTGVYAHDAYNPTIAEFLTFWTLSAMEIAGCAIPKVGTEDDIPFFDIPCTVYDVMGQYPEEAMALYLSSQLVSYHDPD